MITKEIFRFQYNPKYKFNRFVFAYSRKKINLSLGKSFTCSLNFFLLGLKVWMSPNISIKSLLGWFGIFSNSFLLFPIEFLIGYFHQLNIHLHRRQKIILFLFYTESIWMPITEKGSVYQKRRRKFGEWKWTRDLGQARKPTEFLQYYKKLPPGGRHVSFSAIWK